MKEWLNSKSDSFLNVQSRKVEGKGWNSVQGKGWSTVGNKKREVVKVVRVSRMAQKM